jgi:predicted TIM-barrel fold metal-dependent hydrolase
MTFLKDTEEGSANMGKRKIIDAHHHLWDLSRGYNYPWLQDRPLGVGVCGDISPIAKDYLLADFLADTGSYELMKSVHVEAVSSDPAGETMWLQTLADSAGFPHGIVARAELEHPNVEKLLAEHHQYTNLRGIRHIVNWHKNPNLTFTSHSDLLNDSAWLSGFRLLKSYNLSFDLQLYPGQMNDAARLARKNPETLLVLNHAGMPVDRDEAEIKRWRIGIAELSGIDNVVVKISGLGMVDWNWTVASIRPYVLHVIDCFGVNRTMFASNFPVDKLYSSFDALYGAFENIVASFSEAEKDKLFRSNAMHHYRL